MDQEQKIQNSSWITTTIASIAVSLAMGPFGSDIKSSNFVEKGVPVIRGGNLAGGKFHDDDFVYLTEEKADSLKNSNAFPGDIVFTHRGTLGQVGLIPQNARFPRYVVSQSQMKLTCDPTKADPKFVYYFFLSPVGQNELLSNTSITGVPAISRPLSSLKGVNISLPPLPMQKKIVSILSSLDDKIELNTRMNEVLEEIARALFHRWFVEFEFPDAEGRPYKSAGGKMMESGSAPEGWDIGTLGNICKRKRNLVEPRSLEEKLPYVGLEHMPQHHLVLDKWGCSEDATSTKIIFSENDILFGTLRPYFHKVGLSPTNGICSTDILVISPNDKEALSFVLCHVSSDEFVAYANSASEGTRMPRAKWDYMKMYPVIIPSKEIMVQFDIIIQSILSQIRENILMNYCLRDTRDVLLPKLMSGKLPVSISPTDNTETGGTE